VVGAGVVAGALLVLECKGIGSPYGSVKARVGNVVGAVIATGLCSCRLATVLVGGSAILFKRSGVFGWQ
jgi:hypothetical protein